MGFFMVILLARKRGRARHLRAARARAKSVFFMVPVQN
jgi:hypothetical protein